MNQLEGIDREIVSRLNTAYRKVLVVGKDVFVPPVFGRSRPYQFQVRHLRFLYHLTQESDFGKACERTPISQTAARKFLKSNEYKAFAREAMEDEAVHDGWTPRRVVVELDSIYRGTLMKRDDQMEALRMLKDIVLPKKQDGTPSGVTVNLNFPAVPAEVEAKLKAIADEAACIDVRAE